MAFAKFETQQEMLDFFMDPSQFKSFAAEIAATAAPPSFEGFSMADLKAQMGASNAPVAGAGDIDASPATTFGAAGQQSNAQSVENAAQGVPGAGAPDLSGLASGLGGLAKMLGQSQAPGVAPPPGQFVGGGIQPNVRQLPGPPDTSSIQSLIELLSRR